MAVLLSTEWYVLFREWLGNMDLSSNTISYIYNFSIAVCTIIVSYICYTLFKFLLTKVVKKLIKNKKKNILAALHHTRIFKFVSYYIPLILIRYSLSIMLVHSESIKSFIDRFFDISFIILFAIIATSILSIFTEVTQYQERNRSKPIKGLVQFIQFGIYFFTFLIVLSLLISKKPAALIGGLGAASAVLMLIFKDSIMGLVAGVQLSFNNMIKIGDWIEVTKYNVDGEVIDITLTSVKVQNWDKSISTIPAYNLIVNDSVKNWEGMTIYGGRRIARAINIDMRSVKFCTPEMLEKFSRIRDITDYVKTTEKEIEEYNAKNKIDNSLLVNGRRQTNLGVFRAYVTEYLKNKSDINQNMTLMVRQQQPTSNGIPLQIYCFTASTQWGIYENIQSDIFDHILAVLPYFDLNVFQSPSGADFNTALRGQTTK